MSLECSRTMTQARYMVRCVFAFADSGMNFGSISICFVRSNVIVFFRITYSRTITVDLNTFWTPLLEQIKNTHTCSSGIKPLFTIKLWCWMIMHRPSCMAKDKNIFHKIHWNIAFAVIQKGFESKSSSILSLNTKLIFECFE